MSDNVNHPKHYESGPFECIELTRLLSFDWGNVVKYCYRWQSKNDAVIHGIPLYADTNLSGLCNALFSALVNVDWAGLRCVWWAFANNCPKRDILTAIKNKINEIEKDGE